MLEHLGASRLRQLKGLLESVLSHQGLFP
jgi:hypothetical protein